MSSEKGTFSIYYGEGNAIYGPNGVDLSEFNCAVRGITKPLQHRTQRPVVLPPVRAVSSL
jgi:hypothetical protein